MNSNSLLITTCILLLLSQITNAQEAQLDWVNNSQGWNSNFGSQVATDHTGFIYTAGQFQGQLDFGPSSGGILTSRGKADVFLAKHHANGDIIWLKQIGGTGAENIEGLEVGSDGYLYLAGHFNERLVLGNPGATDTLTAFGQGSVDIYIAKMDTAGNLIWAYRQGSDYNEQPNKMRLDESDNIYLVGDFTGRLWLHNKTRIDTFTGNNQTDCFVAKFDSSGNYLWANVAAGPWYDHARGVDIDDKGNVFVAGHYRDIFVVEPHGAAVQLLPHGRDEIFFAAFKQSDGSLKWAKTIGGRQGDVAWDLKADNGGFYLAGVYSDTVDFDPGTGVNELIRADGFGHFYLARYSSFGNFIWVRGATDTIGRASATSIDVDSMNNVFVSGWMYPPLIVPQVGQTPLILSSTPNIEHGFLLSYQANGDLRYGIEAGRTGQAYFEKIIVKQNKVFATGFIKGWSQFGVAPDTSSVVSAVGSSRRYSTDPFLAAYLDCPDFEPNIVRSSPTTLSTDSAKSYIWFMNGVEIPSTNTRIFTPSRPGNFKVQVTQENGCVYTSPAINFVPNSLSNNDVQEWIRYEAKGNQLTVLNKADEMVQIEILDMTARVIARTHLPSGSEETISIPAAGVYLMSAINRNEKRVGKVRLGY